MARKRERTDEEIVALIIKDKELLEAILLAIVRICGLKGAPKSVRTQK